MVLHGKKNRLGIRADGGPGLGWGHIMRCLALAEELEKIGTKVEFLSRKNCEVIEKIKHCGFDVRPLVSISIDEEVEEVLQILRDKDLAVLITDSYQIDEAYLSRIREKVSVLVSIDDLNQMQYPSDLVVNGNIYAPNLSYKRIHEKTKFLLGPQYLLLRREFSNSFERRIADTVEEVLITVGGSDIFNLTPQIMRVINSLPIKRVQVVIGPSFTNKAEIGATAQKMIPRVVLHENVENMSQLMVSCDIAITAGGTTLYELAATGTPGIAVLQADNQLQAAEVMAQRGTVINLGLGDKAFLSQLESSLKLLLDSPNKRREMSIRGRELVDGLGCQRVAREIVNFL